MQPTRPLYVNVLQWILRVVLVGAVLGFVATFPIYAHYAGKAQRIQLVEYDATSAELLGEIGPFVGSPQQIIVEDSRAFLPETGPEGARLVNNVYLRDKGIYPVQLKTVGFVMGWVRVGTGGVALLSLIGLLVLQRWARGRPVTSDPTAAATI